MSASLEKIVFPEVTNSSSNLLGPVVEALRKSERLPASEIDAGRERQLKLLIHHHARTTAQFRERLAASNLDARSVCTLAGLRQLPPLSRRDIQNAAERFISSQIPASHHPLGKVMTSGSTGEPVRVTKTRANRLFWAANTIRDHEWNGRPFGRRMSVIRPGVAEYLEQEDWGPPASELHRTGRAQAIPVITPITEQAKLLAKFQPAVLLVYPNNLAGLCDHWERNGFDLGQLEHIRTVAETVSDSLRVRVQRLTQLKIEDCYSSQEVGMIALQCPHSGLYHLTETVHVEILDAEGNPCAPGQSGRVVVTDLHNFASPLIRYDIGDHAVPGPPCSCGRGLATLSRVLGRDRNLLIRPDGSRHWPLTGFHDFDAVAPVRQYQMVQKTRSSIELRLVTDAPLDASQEEAFRGIVRKVLGYPFEVQVVQTRDRLAGTGSGKFEEFIRETD